jgi:hypothetical protein
LRRERLVVLIASSFVTISCSQLNPRPGPVRAMEPRPNPPSSRAVAATQQAPSKLSDLQDRLRRDRWVTRFWAELTPDQRRRVAKRMQDAAPNLVVDREDHARYWDVMGLEDRLKLVFGSRSVPLVSTTLPSQSTGALDVGATRILQPATGVDSRASTPKTVPDAASLR